MWKNVRVEREKERESNQSGSDPSNLLIEQEKFEWHKKTEFASIISKGSLIIGLNEGFQIAAWIGWKKFKSLWNFDSHGGIVPSHLILGLSTKSIKVFPAKNNGIRTVIGIKLSSI